MKMSSDYMFGTELSLPFVRLHIIGVELSKNVNKCMYSSW